jgi:hypothetical protein
VIFWAYPNRGDTKDGFSFSVGQEPEAEANHAFQLKPVRCLSG